MFYCITLIMLYLFSYLHKSEEKLYLFECMIGMSKYLSTRMRKYYIHTHMIKIYNNPF